MALFQDPNGQPVNAMHDDWNDQRGGFWADWHGEKDQVTLEADYQQGRFNYVQVFSTRSPSISIPTEY